MRVVAKNYERTHGKTTVTLDASCLRRGLITMNFDSMCAYIREIEHASFSPLVLSATGGLAREATIFYKKLASMLSSKWDQTYSSTLCWLRCRLAFSLLRSSIQALRGARSSCGHPIRSAAIDLVNSEARLQL